MATRMEAIYEQASVSEHGRHSVHHVLCFLAIEVIENVQLI